MLNRQRRKKSNSRRATAAVEFAVIAPVFVLILLGTIETCSMIFLQQSLEIAAYEATRVAIVQTSTTESVEKAVDKILKPRQVRDYAVSITPRDFQAAASGTFIRVDVVAKCTSNCPLPTMFFRGRESTGSVEMKKEY
jgi:membrane-bound ClpP family serine protease